METPNKIVMMKAADLSTHPIADRVPMVSPDHPEAVALRASIYEDGILTPLHCDGKGRVFEGRHRLREGKAAGLTEFPCIICADDSAATQAMDTALARRNLNQGQRAIIIAQLFGASAKERDARRLSNLKKGQNAQETPKGNQIVTRFEMARLHEVSEAYLKGADRIIDLTNEANRDKLIARIMAGEVQLGAAVAGLAGGEATAGAPKKAHNYFKLLGNGFASLKRFGKGFARITNPRETAAVVREAEAMASGLPEPLVKAVLRGCKARVAELKKS